ncbi:MAG: thiolase family protein [Planctomycetota bacterium]|jgi:acetyl-CoA C-acetyltransferase
MLKDVYVTGHVRTPFGSFNGALSGLTAGALGSVAIKGTLERSGIKPEDVDEVLFGNVIGAGLGQNVARQATLGAGLPISCGATTINKVCGSSLRAVVLGAQGIQCGDADVVLAGGAESMTNAPYFLKRARSGYRMGHGELFDALIHDGLWDVYKDKHMGTCGDLCAHEYGITREDQDHYAIESYRRAIASWEDGFFAEGIVPVDIKSRRETVTFAKDEDVAKFVGEEKLRSLRGAFGPESTVTAGNASGINDGAASMLVFGSEAKDRLGIKPSARILGHANVAMDSEWFTIAPIHAIRKLCDQLNWSPKDVDLFEINEAFSVVALVAIRELGLSHEKVNVAGGAVAIGHPIGATGARIANTLIRALERQNKKTGIACLCIGGGEATAVAFERV